MKKLEGVMTGDRDPTGVAHDPCTTNFPATRGPTDSAFSPPPKAWKFPLRFCNPRRPTLTRFHKPPLLA